MKFARRAEPRQPRPRPAVETVRNVEEQPDAHFDINRDITPQAISEIKGLVKWYIDKHDTWRIPPKGVYEEDYYPDDWDEVAAKIAIPLAVLFPNRKEEFGLHELLPLLKKELNSADEGALAYFWITTALILIDPEKRSELHRTKHAWDMGVRTFNASLNDGSLFGEQAIALGVVFPEKTNQLGSNEEVFEEQMQLAEADKNAQQIFEFIPFLYRAAALKLYFPHHSEDLGLDEPTWKRMREVLELALHNNNPQFISETAMCLAILAAEKAEFTKDGFIKITPHQPNIGQTKPLPSRPQL